MLSEQELNARIAKFKRRAPQITSQHHADMIMASFPVEHHEAVMEAVRLSGDLKLKSITPEEIMEIVPRNPEAPAPQELTAQRLYGQAQQIVAMRAQSEQDQKTIAELQDQVSILTKQLTGK